MGPSPGRIVINQFVFINPVLYVCVMVCAFVLDASKCTRCHFKCRIMNDGRPIVKHLWYFTDDGAAERIFFRGFQFVDSAAMFD